MERIQHKCNRLQLLAICLITITLKLITITIALTFVLKHPQKENKTHLHSFV